MLLLETERLSIVISKSTEEDHIIYNDIFLKDSEVQVGEITLESNGWVGYRVFEEHQENGYATEALRACRDCLLRSGVEPYLEIHGRNEKSQGVAKKCGFSCEPPYNKQGCDIWQYKKNKK